MQFVRPVSIKVTYVAGSTSLEVSPATVALQPGQPVHWQFENVPKNYLAFVHFPVPLGSTLPTPFGPFQYLEPTCSSVLGIGNTGVRGDYRYTAMVLNRKKARAKGEGTIQNGKGGKDTSPDALVIYDPSKSSLEVKPYTLRLAKGRRAIWYIQGIPSNHFVTFEFPGFENRMTGPFTHLSLSRGDGSACLVTGIGFRVADQTEVHEEVDDVTYCIQVRKPDGSLAGGEDPVIESVGPPGPTFSDVAAVPGAPGRPAEDRRWAG